MVLPWCCHGVIVWCFHIAPMGLWGLPVAPLVIPWKHDSIMLGGSTGHVLTVLTWWLYTGSMVIPWWFHGTLVVLQWCLYGAIDVVMRFYGAFMVLPWGYGAFMLLPWVYGISVLLP